MSKAMQSPLQRRRKNGALRSVVQSWQLYVLLLPALICLVIFHFIPMYGLSIAFKDLRIGDALWEGRWVGLKHFQRLFSSSLSGTLDKNTLVITFTVFYSLAPAHSLRLAGPQLLGQRNPQIQPDRHLSAPSGIHGGHRQHH